MSSASSRPGSRRCVCRSTKPGLTMHPAASITVLASRFSPTALITPSANTTSAWRVPEESMTVPPLMTVSVALGTQVSIRVQEEEQDGHAHGNPIRDLFGDDGVGRVGDVGSDLHPAVHRARMQDERARLEARGALGVESVELRVLPQRRQ